MAHARLAVDEVRADLWALRNGTERQAFVLVLVLAIFNQAGHSATASRSHGRCHGNAIGRHGVYWATKDALAVC